MRRSSVPVRIIAGSQDQIVDTDAHSVRLHEELAFSTLQRVPACGHMVHHAASEDVLAAIAALAEAARGQGGRARDGEHAAAAQLAAYRGKPGCGLMRRVEGGP